MTKIPDLDLNRAEPARASKGFEWVPSAGEGLRWARPSDLPEIVALALEAFQWPYDAARLKRLWSSKLGLNLFVVLERQQRVMGFMEVFWKRTRWWPPARIPFRTWLHEWLAHRLLCDRRYLKDGPYLFLIARHRAAPKGSGAQMVKELQKHHEVVSVMYDRRNGPLDAYYRTLGFTEQRNPLGWPIGVLIERRYVYAQWRADACPAAGRRSRG